MRSILIVEDDHGACQILERVLSARYPGTVIHTAGDGRCGLERFVQHRPEIVITDVNMPEMDGIKMAWNIKSIDSSTRVIVLTAFGNKSISEASEGLGVTIDSYLLKPINFEGLFHAIENLRALLPPSHSAGH